MNNKKLFLIVITIIALIIGAVMILQQKALKPSPTPKAEVTAVEETVEEKKIDEIPAAPKDEESEIPLELDSLPTMDDMKELSEEEVHHTPEMILESARDIGKIIDAAEKNPELREKTVKFLLECAESENIVPSIRAVCWKNTMKAVTNWKVFVPISQAKVSVEIKNLANKLP